MVYTVVGDHDDGHNDNKRKWSSHAGRQRKAPWL